MDAELGQQKIKTALKQLLKRQNYTYADLAKVWECSVPTVKRQLGAEELPLSRLLSVMEWLDLSLTELQKLAESEVLERPQYTLKQIEFLAKNPREFSFLMKLYDEKSPAQIATIYKIPAATLEKILIQLEKYDLIRVGKAGQVKPQHAQIPAMRGALAQAHIKRVIDSMALFQKNRISQLLIDEARGQSTRKGGLMWHVAEVSEKTSNEFTQKFGRLMNELTEISRIENKSLKKSELKYCVASSGVFLCEPNDPDLPLALNIMDEGLRNLGSGLPLG